MTADNEPAMYDMIKDMVEGQFRWHVSKIQGGSEAEVRSSLNRSIDDVTSMAGAKRLAQVLMARPDLIDLAIPTLSPGSNMSDAIQAAMAMTFRREFEDKVLMTIASLDPPPAGMRP